MHVLQRHHPDNDKSAADRIRSLVDSNKLQVSLEANTPPAINPIPTSPPTTVHQSSQPLKSKMNSAIRKTKQLLTFSKHRVVATKANPIEKDPENESIDDFVTELSLTRFQFSL